MTKALFFIVIVMLCTDTIFGNEDCSDAISCDCLSSGSLIRLASKEYVITNQTSCIIENHADVTITGDPDGDTTLKCTSEFNIVFINTRNLTISNIKMRNCGGILDQKINQTVVDANPYFHFDNGTKYVLMFLNSFDITLRDIMMVDTTGYSIIAFNALGIVELSNVNITNSTSIMAVNGSYSGSGIAFVYADHGGINNTELKINNGTYFNNTGTIVQEKYDSFLRVMNLGYANDRIPVLGAACITIYYLQSNYNLDTTIYNVEFLSNNGSFSSSISIIQMHNTNSQTRIENCVFNDSKAIQDFSNNDTIRIGGIYYINLELEDGFDSDSATLGKKAEVLTVLNSTFENLEGKLGTAFHLEKNSVDTILVIVRIERCYFVSNKGDTGSVVYAKDRQTKWASYPSLGGSFTVELVNINAEDNVLSPGSSIEGATSNFITGIFYVYNCLVTVQCTRECKFINNQPSVFYGYTSALSMSGSVFFLNNKARFGGAVRLIDTAMYIDVDSSIYFKGNNVTGDGGALEIQLPLTNIQSQDYCPFQFMGLSRNSTITNDDIGNFQRITNINVTFEDNYAGVNSSDERFESIYSNVFYICSWFPRTSVQTTIGPNTLVENGTRQAVYHRTFNYLTSSTSNLNPTENHLNILAISPCICNETDDFGNFVEDCLNGNIINMADKLRVIPGRRFVLKVTAINTVGSVGHSAELISRAYNGTSGDEFPLERDQLQRPFSVDREDQCAEVNFTIFVSNKTASFKNTSGILLLSVAVPRIINVSFTFEDCPVGFEIKRSDSHYACKCSNFITRTAFIGFQCDDNSGLLTRLNNNQSWIGVIDEGGNPEVQYVEFCSPTLCSYSSNILSFSLTEKNILCGKNHEGRACGECKDSYSRVFGSNSCKKCSDYWLFTILLYAVLGVILVVILFILKFTVTIGLINGLIFFCNVMSINEELFFNEKISSFSFLRVFISIFNLDLGFEICFYDEMTQVAKTGLQFVFPVYLWPLIFVIVYLSRYSHQFQTRVSNTAVPVFATLILLSYAKILRTAISVFSFADVKSETYGSIRVWRPDPSVDYWDASHVVLFVIGTLFLLFIFPFAISFTYPRILHYKKFSYFFPLFDCFVAPYKDKYRFWFGVRAVILIYLALMETVIFDDKEALLLSSVIVVGSFAIAQAYIRPFKSTIVNCVDLTFTTIFLLLSSTTLYFHPTMNGYDKVDVTVYVLGYFAFIVFCFVVVYQINEVSKKSYWYITTVEKFWKNIKKYKDNEVVNILFSSTTIAKNVAVNRFHRLENVDIPTQNRFQESYYEEM
ncbi:uncharacterized protein [Dysidea avara]|uniref:uncharacterized protein n=1 Tax=Dysidea avara TaxID=196820 RepID=UPI003323A2B9